LMPGPAGTESRCEPITICFVGSPFLLVPITLNVSTVTMVVTLAKVYGISLTWNNAQRLIESILQAAGWVMLGEMATHMAASLFKGLTLGSGTVLTALPQGAAAGPARYWRAPGGLVGFISPLTQNFCGGCNRVRVASNGDLRSCLGGRAQAPLHALIRGGATDEQLMESIRQALGDKPEGHRFTEPGAGSALLSMMGIGG